MANHLIHDKFIGAYVYAIKVDGVVRYIGKGRRYRAIEHFRHARELNRRRDAGEKVKARLFHNKLAKAIRLGAKCGYEIIAHSLDDAAAYEREKAEIAARNADGNLWNMRSGGVGTDGEVIKKLWTDPEFRSKVMKARQKTMYGNPDWCERQRQAAIIQWSDPEKKARHYRKHRELWDNPEAAAAQRALLKKVWADPIKSARKSELVKSQWTPERRAAMSEKRRQHWMDPSYRSKVLAWRKSKDKNG